MGYLIGLEIIGQRLRQTMWIRHHTVADLKRFFGRLHQQMHMVNVGGCRFCQQVIYSQNQQRSDALGWRIHIVKAPFGNIHRERRNILSLVLLKVSQRQHTARSGQILRHQLCQLAVVKIIQSYIRKMAKGISQRWISHSFPWLKGAAIRQKSSRKCGIIFMGFKCFTARGSQAICHFNPRLSTFYRYSEQIKQ